MRYVLCGQKITGQSGPCYYISKSGFVCYTAANIGVIHSLDDARKELEYFRREMPIYRWSIERLPPRLSVAKAVLSAVPVE